MPPSDSQVVTIEGRRLKLTNLGKVLYPETGTTKAEVLAFYAEIAPFLVPHAADRPATRKRWPDGVEGQVFFQKDLDESTPEWVPRQRIQHSSGAKAYPLVNDLPTLTWMAQIASLEVHVPQWRFDADGEPLNPDRIVLDLDPGPGAGLEQCAEVAFAAREILLGMGLEPFPVTSGSKGIHLYAALDGRQSSDGVSAVAKELARVLEADMPQLVVSDMKKSLREGKVLVDWSQNNGNKTTICPYSLRGTARPTVATPRTWDELGDPGLAHVPFQEALERVRDLGDLLAPLAPRREGTDRLERYRSMRDAAKTPEPVPAEAPAPSEGRSFVIQEHHARRLHYDFRLEHDGVLVSWALPKNVPTDPGENHLAVQTEDHPLEYGSFEGTIPEGEYGAGVVTIWDRGTYELEKFRDDEVIVVLHGERLQGKRVALIRTAGSDDKKNWLIHLMKDQTPFAPPLRLQKRTHARPPVASAPPAPARSASPAAPASPAAADSPRAPASPPAATEAPAPTPEARPARAAASGARRVLGGATESRLASTPPMLASAGRAGEVRGPDWAYEMKWDGVRAIVTVDGDQVRVASRNGIDVTATYPEVAELADLVTVDAVLDGEIIAPDATGRPDFGRLQTRMKLTKPRDVAEARKRQSVDLLLFDVLERDGEDLTQRPYDERRRLLEQLVDDGEHVHVPPAFDGELDEALEVSRTLGLEGVVAKRRSSTYSPGRRSTAWVKLKHSRTQDVVIGGWREGRGNRSSTIGSLLLGIPGPDGLRYVGRAGSGFTERALADAMRTLAGLERTDPPFLDVPREDRRDAHWVEPTLVGEVEFTEWTPAGHLRHPVWRGWRPDKSPDEVAPE
ncbi:ATP-dependent DNA ligase [Desertivibrio insolitus]|uniref:ATP-dependent DNA ligase n=1 Tax=Herbiconiux sp. SYSU D00978 TaxID=2812562 RepID=UPI001A95F4AB|nr:ATP-dependent DNA ligase [Herbiconiux sp. SYSU D00978]